jgi:hypothetical protein
MSMSRPKHLYPCFLPERFRERLRDYQADIDRSVEYDQAGRVSDPQPDPVVDELPQNEGGTEPA